jgi:hypothetical protein
MWINDGSDYRIVYWNGHPVLFFLIVYSAAIILRYPSGLEYLRLQISSFSTTAEGKPSAELKTGESLG